MTDINETTPSAVIMGAPPRRAATVAPTPPSRFRALVFPGQGSQHVGMGRDLAKQFPAARAVFNEVDETLGERLSRLMFEGPLDELTRTENAQPAIMAVSAAIVRTLENETGLPVEQLAAFVAGHSLGEYSALVVARSIALGDAARLLRRRGLAMRDAGALRPGTMMTVIGLDLVVVRDIARAATLQSPAGAVCVAANDNGPGQVVISGTPEAVALAAELAFDQGARRVVPLSVSGPFHCPLMESAAWDVAAALTAVDLRPPVVPLIANVTAREATSPQVIRENLVAQVTGMVRWRETCLHLKRCGVQELLELGPGTVLSGLARSIDRSLTGRAIGTAGTLSAFAESL